MENRITPVSLAYATGDSGSSLNDTTILGIRTHTENPWIDYEDSQHCADSNCCMACICFCILTFSVSLVVVIYFV
jgi:hypothetical protein